MADQSINTKDSRKGWDYEGNRYERIDELWGRNDSESDAWYEKSAQYWETTPLSEDGVLGGYGHISPIDVSSSKNFLQELIGMQRRRAIDCGAGIGRVAEHVLMPLFDIVDQVEQSPSHVETARQRLKNYSKSGDFFCEGLQKFVPRMNFYDCVWVQWVVGYLTDDDLRSFLKRCACSLKKGGYIVLKENVTKSESFFVDQSDNCVTRSNSLFLSIFKECGLTVIKAVTQKQFPSELLPVRMYALQSVSS